MEFKDYLKKLREKKNVSQQNVADALHISRSVVAKWETGISLPQEEYYDVLVEYFEIEKEELIKIIKNNNESKVKDKKSKKVNIKIILPVIFSVLIISVLSLFIVPKLNTVEKNFSDFLAELDIINVSVIENESDEKYELIEKDISDYYEVFSEVYDYIDSLSFVAYKNKKESNIEYEDQYNVLLTDNLGNRLVFNSKYVSFNNEEYYLKSIDSIETFTLIINKLLESSLKANLIFELDSNGEGYIIKGLNKSDFTRLVLPSTYNGLKVIKIEDSSFANNKNIEEVFISKNIKEIGSQAFYSCEKLKVVSISESIVNISDYAFRRCVSLKEIEIPNSVEFIGKGILDECTNLKKVKTPFVGSERDSTSTAYLGYYFDANSYEQNELKIPESLKEIELTETVNINSNCFVNCKHLEKIYLPSCLEYIGEYAFSNCINIKVLYFETNDNFIKFDYNAFKNAEIVDVFWDNDIYSWMSLDFKCDTANPNDCSVRFYTKDSSVFKEVTEILIKKDIKEIKDFVFYKLNIKKLIFEEGSQIEEIGTFAFAYTYIKELVLPKSLKYIHASAFKNCKLLNKVVFEENSQIKRIDEWAFSNSALKEIIIPDGITYIGKELFKGIRSMDYVCIPFLGGNADSNNDAFFVFEEEISIKTLEITRQEVLPKECFSGFENIEKVIIGGGVKTIKESAFQLCTKIHTVVLGENVEIIEDFAFSSCYGLSIVCNLSNLNITYGQDSYTYGGIGSKATWIGNNIEEMPEILYDETKNFKFIYIDNEYYMIDVVIQSELALPDYINGNSYHLSKYLFSQNDNIYKVVLGKGVLSIGELCFFGCENLIEVEMNEGLKEVKDEAFNQCKSIEVVKFPSTVISIGNEIFYSCENLKDVYIRKGVINMGEMLFAGSAEPEHVYVEEESKPSTWDYDWDRWTKDKVVWGYTE